MALWEDQDSTPDSNVARGRLTWANSDFELDLLGGKRGKGGWSVLGGWVRVVARCALSLLSASAVACRMLVSGGGREFPILILFVCG